MKKALFIIVAMLVFVMPFVSLAEQEFIGNSEHLSFSVDRANGDIIVNCEYSSSVIRQPDNVITLLQKTGKYFDTASTAATSCANLVGKQDCMSIWFFPRGKASFAAIYILDDTYGWVSSVFVNNKQEIDIMIELIKRSNHVAQEIKEQLKKLESVQ